jgi:DNA-directed RNA polymerase subunit RPC12/RpoP
MGFTIEQDCPQCGAPIDLKETDRLLSCPYCNVKNFLFSPGYFRYVLPHKPGGKELIYAPYLRFKGSVFFCMGQSVGHRIVDITHIGMPLKGLPLSLGVRPQALKMRFVGPHTQGSFQRFTLKASEILSKAGRLTTGSSKEKLFHQTYIGETLSLIYFPLYVEGGRLFDAILNRPIAKLPPQGNVFEESGEKNPPWKVTFIATLCPRCGWDLEAKRDSMVLTCSNCNTAWEALEARFAPVDFLQVPGQGEDTIYLPFWKISAEVKGVGIHSFADFIRFTNQPRVVGKEQEKGGMSFWSPAFKIRPKVYLNLSKQMTLSQERFQMQKAIPKKKLYPINLPRKEAVQGLKVLLASSAVNKKKVLPLLPSAKFDIKKITLIFLPFTDQGHDMIQQDLGAAINKKTLEYGRYL